MRSCGGKKVCSITQSCHEVTYIIEIQYGCVNEYCRLLNYNFFVKAGYYAQYGREYPPLLLKFYNALIAIVPLKRHILDTHKCKLCRGNQNSFDHVDKQLNYSHSLSD